MQGCLGRAVVMRRMGADAGLDEDDALVVLLQETIPIPPATYNLMMDILSMT